MYLITPDESFKTNYSYNEYPMIIDNGNGTINVVIYIKSASGKIFQIVFKTEQLGCYSIIPTGDSQQSRGPDIVRGIYIKDNINGFLSVQIMPLYDNTGNVSIIATTSIGSYSFNGTIIKPLEMQPILYDMATGQKVENNQIQFAPGHYWDLAPVQARNKSFYVITKKVEGNQTQHTVT